MLLKAVATCRPNDERGVGNAVPVFRVQLVPVVRDPALMIKTGPHLTGASTAEKTTNHDEIAPHSGTGREQR